MGVYKFRIIITFVLILVTGSFTLVAGNLFTQEGSAADDTTTFVSPYEEDNDRCLKCHGQARFEYNNEILGRKVNASY